MANAAIDIPNLLYLYADLMDAGDLARAARLFDHACLVANGHEVSGAAEIEAFWRRFVKIHDDGSLGTRHLITNPQITLSADGDRATCRSQWTALQKTGEARVEVIGSGRYIDDFALIDARWRFTRREYAQVDFWGDASAHLRVDLDGLKG